MGSKSLKIVFILACILMITGIFLLSKELFFNSESNNPDTSGHKIFSCKLIDNGADIEERNVTCNTDEEFCYVTLPNGTRKDGTFIGYGLKEEDKTPLYKPGDQVKLTGDMSLYGISYKVLNVNIDTSNITEITEKTITCNSYNEDKGCDVKLPNFNKKGYVTKGYSPNRDSLTGIYYPYVTLRINKDMTLYPIIATAPRKGSYSIKETITIGNSYIDIENGCNSSVYATFNNYLSKLFKNAPFLNTGGKITYMSENSFLNTWGSNYVGMNYGAVGLRNFDVRCSSSIANNFYATIAHELTHTWDFYYKNYNGNYISEQSDIQNLFNKYKNMNNRPFRDYSYTRIEEFFADMFRYYYLKFIDPIYEYSSRDYPSDIKQVLEKYICIANNNYDEKKCK